MRFLIVAIGLLLISGCGCTQIDPGNVGVSVKKCGKEAGVDPSPIPVGYYQRSLFCEEVIEYPTNLQTLILTKSPHEGGEGDESITVTSSQGMPINVDVSLSFTLDGTKVPKLYTKYRNDLPHITHTFVRQTVREVLQGEFAKYTAEQLYAEKREIARAEVQQELTDKLKGDGFIIVQFTINETRVPEQVTQAINAKVAMTQDAQKAEAEVRKTQAIASQKIAEARGFAEAKKLEADAQAYYNKTISSSITPQLIQMEQLKKWNGQMPQVSGTGSNLFLNLK